ncbi:MAG: response regulator transcription factor [Planctomycetota bacterium]
MKSRILLADDHKILRDGLRVLLEREPDLEVVGEAENGTAAVKMARQLKPDVVVMDVGMPESNGIEATRRLQTELPEVRVIALTMHSEKQYLTQMLRSGAAGYLLKDCATEELVKAIEAVVAGGTYLSPQIAGQLTEGYAGYGSPQPAEDSDILSRRECDFLQLMSEGYSTKEIAAKLGISVKTVETYRAHVMKKLKLYNVAELVKYAIRHGLTVVE